MRPQSTLHACVAVALPAIYCCMLLGQSFSGAQVAVLSLIAAAGVVGAIWQMTLIARAPDAPIGVKVYIRLYRSARLGLPHALVSAAIVAASAGVSYGLSLELERWAFGAIEGVRLAAFALIGLTTWRLNSSLWMVPVATWVLTDLLLFSRLPPVRQLDQWCVLLVGMAAVFGLLEAQHFLDRLIGLRRVETT